MLKIQFLYFFSGNGLRLNLLSLIVSYLQQKSRCQGLNRIKAH